MTKESYVPVPAPVPPPPQVTLIGSSLRPTDAGADDPDKEPLQVAELPADLRAELADNTPDEVFVRGFTYAPENHYAGEARDFCDFTSVDQEPLPEPGGLAIEAVAHGSGGLPAVTHSYQVTAVNSNGETTPCALVTKANALHDWNVLTWDPVAPGFTALTYKVYGRVGGSIGLLATVGPFDDDETPTWTDEGTPSPGAAPPTQNTTGGMGSYGNLGIVKYQPWLVVAIDTCSAFGFEARDFKGRAERLCDNATPGALEKEFWRGDLAQAEGYPNNFLANSADPNWQDLTPGGGPPSITRGQQILQDYLANLGFGGQGMLHVQQQTAGNLLNVRRIGTKMYDIFDNLVVPGVGYDGSPPVGDSPTDGTAWIYATDMVACRVSKKIRIIPDPFSEAFDWGQGGEPNTITYRAMRYVAASFDGFAHAGVKVTLAT